MVPQRRKDTAERPPSTPPADEDSESEDENDLKRMLKAKREARRRQLESSEDEVSEAEPGGGEPAADGEKPPQAEDVVMESGEQPFGSLQGAAKRRSAFRRALTVCAR